MGSKDASPKIKEIRTSLFQSQVMVVTDVEIDLKTSLVKDSEKALFKAKSWKEVSTDVNQEHEHKNLNL
jgi:hypothetical protein